MNSRLMKIKCNNCGAEYRINSRGELICSYCGSKIYLNDKDFEEYQKARDEMLLKDRFNQDDVNNNGDYLGLWNGENSIRLADNIHCKYYYDFEKENKEIYINKDKLIIIYNDKNIVDIIKNNLNNLVYPSADIKGLSKYLPQIIFYKELKDGRVIVGYEKSENVYPLYLMKDLDAKQVAWIISRMENLGCLLEFNEIDFSKIDIKDFYFNPKTHEIFLLDGWEYIQNLNSKQNYLHLIREIALQILNESTAPEMCIDFLKSKPEDNAYDDFSKWDNVIENGFNGHNFHRFK